MQENLATKSLLNHRKLTRAVGEIVSERMKQHVETLAPLFRQRAIFGEHIQGSGKEVVKGADQAFRELQALYERVAASPQFHLPKELNSPLMQMTSSLQLTPWEYTYVAKSATETKTVTVTCPFKSILTYSGYTTRRLRELLADRNRNDGELQQFVLHYLAMHVVVTKQPGLASLLEQLHFSLGSDRLVAFGELPVTYIASSISTSLPPDELVIESTELSGKDAFEELVNSDDIRALGDPVKERLLELVRTFGADDPAQ